MTAIRIIEPGLATTVQDLGRTGYQRYGIPVSGALDPEALRLANGLVGHDPTCAALELRYLGPSFEVESERLRIAVVGAEINGLIKGQAGTRQFTRDRTVTIEKGDHVKIGPLKRSTTAYLSISNRILLPPVMGSLSTYTKGHFGGFEGRALRADDMLPLDPAATVVGPDLALASEFELGASPRIRCVMGPQDDHFTATAIDRLLNTTWTVTKDADRMGLRLQGPELDHKCGYNITSDGIAPGSIQVPGSKQPIVLLSDRQTTGGYPKIATVISADLPKIGRLGPGASFGFDAVSAAQAITIARERDAELQGLIDSIGPYHPPGEIDTDALYQTNLISAPIGME